MNNALISPSELVYSYDGTLIGERIAEVSQNPFPIAEPLYWIECADEVNAEEWYFQTETASCQLIPLPPALSETLSDAEKLDLIRIERDKRLAASDWTQLPDVIASHDAAWLDAWNVYRQALRDMTADPALDLDNPVYPTPPSA
mgnify:CR=1 FL=1